MMGTREKLRNGDEYDALTRKGRRSYKVFLKAGRAARTKRRFWKRIRKAARLCLDGGFGCTGQQS